jgi:hypothetical protein
MNRLLPILFIILLAVQALASGLWNETETPVSAGSVIKSWERSPLLSITNTYGAVPQFESVMEKITLYPDNSYTTKFIRRTGLNMGEYAGQPIPLLHPETGTIIGTFTVEELGVYLYSITKFSEDERKRKELAANPPVELCYNTSGVTVPCP